MMPRLLAAVFAAFAGAPRAIAQPTTAASVAFTHVTIIDVAGGLSQTDMTVGITGSYRLSVKSDCDFSVIVSAR